MKPDDSFQRPRQDARVAQTRRLVLTAARRLLLDEGQDAVTPTRLASLTGISRSTIYRNWGDPADIVFEATGTDTQEPPFEPTGHVRDDLVRYLEAFREMLSTQQGTLLATRFDRAEHNPSTEETIRSIATARSELIQRLLGHADDDFAVWHALLVGPLVFQRFMARQPIGDALLDLIADIYISRRDQQHAPGVGGSGE